VVLDRAYCREVADHYDAAPETSDDEELRRRYDILKREDLRQYEAILATGVTVEPWTEEGQPYRGSAQLIEHVVGSSTIFVYPTGTGFGPGKAHREHPLRESANVRAGGLDLCHNDVLRVVHDVFGHVLHRSGFGPRGEFLATYGHLRLSSPDVLPVLFAEHVGQICWFYFGPHLRDRRGWLPRRGDRGYVPPDRRPYPAQKVVAFPEHLLNRFIATCEGTRA
jgi:hypothetical protein